MVIQVILIAVFILFAFYAIHDIYKKEKAYRELNSIYKKREEREKRRLRLIAEKPQNVILASEINKIFPPIMINFIGSFDSLEGIKAKNYDFVVVKDCYYLYKDRKWYEVVDDIPRLPKGLQSR